MFSTAVETFAETDTAQPLFSQKKINGSFLHRGEIRRLVKLAAVRGAIAEEHDHHAPGLPHLLRERDAGADHEVAAERAALAEDASRGVDYVHHATLAAVRAALLEGDVAEDLLRGKTARDPVGEAAVAVEHGIVGLQRGERSDLASLVAGAGMEGRGQLTRHRQLADPLLQPPRQQHLAKNLGPGGVVHRGAPIRPDCIAQDPAIIKTQSRGLLDAGLLQ